MSDPLDEIRRVARDGAPRQRLGQDERRFLEECAEVVGMLGELPAEADEWAESATETVAGIARTIEASGRVTEAQDRAVQNVRRAVERWLGG